MKALINRTERMSFLRLYNQMKMIKWPIHTLRIEVILMTKSWGSTKTIVIMDKTRGIEVINLCCWYRHHLLVNMFLHGQVRGVYWGYHYISQLGETFYQGMRESLTISTYSISIVGSQVYILVQKQRERERERQWERKRTVGRDRGRKGKRVDTKLTQPFTLILAFKRKKKNKF